MQPAKPAYPPPASYGMGAPQQPVVWKMQRLAPQQREQGGCLRTSVLVTGILHIVLSVFTFNVLGCIGGGFQIAGASANLNTFSGGKRTYLLVAFILTIIEAAFTALGAIIIWAVAVPALDHLDAVKDAYAPTESPEFEEVYDWGTGFAKDFYVAMAVTFTIILVLLIIMAILIYKYYDSVPRPPPQQPLRVIQPVTGVNTYPQPGSRF